MTGESTSQEITSQEWYWGNASKETLAAAMQNRPDGTFAVRDASTSGCYTLTIRVKGRNKLVRIIVINGKCGFTEDTLDFDSVVDLIHFYKGQSLKAFNEELDVKLLYPLAIPKQAEPIDANVDEDRQFAQVLKCELEGLHAEYERVSHRYDQLFSKRTEYADQLVRKIQAQAAYASGEKEYAKQLKKLQTNVETNNNGEAIDEPVITQTMEALEYTTRMMSEKRAEAHRWVELLEEAIETFDEELETLRPKLVDVHRRRDEYMIKLRDAYVHPDHIDKMLTNVSTNMSLENDRVTLILLSIPLKWSAETWFTTNSSKEAALKAIREQKSQLPEGRRDGVFVIRPSQTHVGFFALNISIGGTIQSSLIQYKDPSMDDIAGFGFHGTDMFFATLVDFVRYYTAYKLKEHNPLLDTTLNMPAFAPADMINEELEETL